MTKLKESFSIRVYKENFHFSAAHYMVFEDGTREPLHGHNYHVRVSVNHPLKNDVVIDFLDIKPIVKNICDTLDHRLLLPKDNHLLRINDKGEDYFVELMETRPFTFPKEDCPLLPITNTSVERLAQYIGLELRKRIHDQFGPSFSHLEVEVEESLGQCGVYTLEEDA